MSTNCSCFKKNGFRIEFDNTNKINTVRKIKNISIINTILYLRSMGLEILNLI